MVRDRRRFGLGAVLLAAFLGVLAVLFSPIFGNGNNALDHLDGVFNSISKASAYHVPACAEKARRLEGTAVSVRILAGDAGQAALLAKLLAATGATAQVEGRGIALTGDLGRVLAGALADADAMFGNDARAVTERRGIDARRALHGWHVALGEVARDLNRQARFAESAAVRDAMTRALEPAYNYYGVTAVSMKDMAGIALLALVGYVLYTVWYGYAILFLFEGWGLKLEH
jgi:hypothetical protein